MTKTLSQYIATIANCSYQAYKEWDLGIIDYSYWLDRHYYYSGRVNRTFLKCFKNIVSSWPTIKKNNIQKQDLIDLLYEIYKDHLKFRASYFKNRNYTPSKKEFITKSLIQANFFLIKSLLKSVAYLGKYYLIPKSIKAKKLIVVKGFPSHAFNISSNKSKIPFSFGDYLTKKLSINKINNVVSIDEYIRPSLINKKSKLFFKYTDIKEQKATLKRTIIKSKISVLFFLRNLKLVFSISMQNVKYLHKSFELFYLILRRKFFAYPFLTFCKDVKKNKSSISKNYFLGFLYAFYYPANQKPHPIEFLYSKNIWNPPQTSKYKIISKKSLKGYQLKNFTIGNLTVYQSSAGFSDLPKKINSYKIIINRRLRIKIPIHKLICEPAVPTQLGFETVINLDKPHDTRFVALFDTPPDAKDGQIRRSIFGDFTHDFYVLRQFLEDIIEIASETGFFVYHKPKYSLKNYMRDYQVLIEKMSAKFSANYCCLSPYTNVLPLLKNCSASFSFIGSSTYDICKQFCKKSFVYLPNSISVLCTKREHNIISTKNKLQKLFQKIK